MLTVLVLFALLFGAQGSPAKPVKPRAPAAVCAGYDACPVSSPDTLNVHLIPHSHDDVGWNKNVDQYYFQDVQNVIGSVVGALRANPERKFVQVETAFFKKWWEQQNTFTKQSVQDLVNNGQLEMINSAWSANDEAAVHYQSTIDQFTYGFRYLEDILGECTRTRVGWQVDAFGHSREHASIMAQLGFDSVYFARLDYRDKDTRLNTRTTEMIWRGSSNLGNTSDLFTSVLYNHYSAPGGFCFDIVCNDPPIIPDEDSPDYNYPDRVAEFANYIRYQASVYPTNNILIPMGDDFRYQAAMSDYINTDLLIKGFDLFEQRYNDQIIKVFYSTPSCYAKAVNDYALANDYHLQIKTDDFFPHSDYPTTSWTGFYTSRPASKRFERYANNLLQTVKQLAVVGQEPFYSPRVNPLQEALGVMQHHDAITGTELQGVAKNYHFFISRAIQATRELADSVISTIVTGGSSESLDLSYCLLSNVTICAQTLSDSFTVVVYNPLSHEVSSPISVPVSSLSWTVTGPDGTAIPNQADATIADFSFVDEGTVQGYILAFVAVNIPPLGFNVYQVTRSFGGKMSSKLNNYKKINFRVGYPDAGFEIDENTGLLSSITLNGVTIPVSQDFFYYEGRASNAYIFDPNGDARRLSTDATLVSSQISGDVYEGVVQTFNSWTKQAIKVYNDDRQYIEFDWVIGPINVTDNVGKEIISRFSTNLATDATFYTDSNGREQLQRIRDYRPTYEYTNEEPVAGNYYPITSKIVLKDETQGIELAVLTDRAAGGSSLQDGQLEIMAHRALLADDGRGEPLNEYEYGQGIVVRGHYYLTLGSITPGENQRSAAALQRELAQKIHLAPWTFFSNANTENLAILQFSALTTSLPDNVKLLTLEPWNENTLLLRLEHVLEIGEDPQLSQEVTVDLTDLFTQFTVTALEETTLGGNILLEDNVRLHWPGSEAVKGHSDTLKLSEKLKRAPADLIITLAAMQIRTFRATVQYN